MFKKYKLIIHYLKEAHTKELKAKEDEIKFWKSEVKRLENENPLKNVKTIIVNEDVFKFKNGLKNGKEQNE